MILSILRGSSEIGGSCVKITSGDTTIIIDMGMPLYGKDGKPFDKKQAKTVLPDVLGLYNKPYVKAILVSHAHADHYGLVSFSAKGISVYAGQGTQKLIEISSIINGQNIDASRYHKIQDRQKCKIGPFEITPYIVDHSAYESMSFLIRAEGKNIFYSGDFRAGGPRNWMFSKFVREYKVKTDALLLEGTLIDGQERDYASEDDVLKNIIAELRKPYDGLTLAAYSSQNIGRFVSIYKACLMTKKTLVIDPYAAQILDMVKSKSMPGPLANNIKIYCVNNRVSKEIFKIPGTRKFGRNKIQVEDIVSAPEKYVITDRRHIREIFKPYLVKPRLIWSLWDGYLKENKKFWDDCGAEIIPIHASGHADIKTLKRLVTVVKPSIIIPIHTNKPQLYSEVFENEKIKILKDNEEYMV
jgi:ribonuclease J